MKQTVAIFSVFVALAIGVTLLSIHYRKNSDSITIPKSEYVKLKEDAEALPKEQHHNEHLAGATTDTLKQNIELESQVATCKADKDVQHVKELLIMQDGIITKQREQIAGLNKKLKDCE